jgi:hypothetical protein
VTKLSDWMLQKMVDTGLDAARLQELTGISDSTINESIRTNKWSKRTVEKLSEALGDPMTKEEADERFVVNEWRRDRTVPRPDGPDLPKAIAKMESAQAKGKSKRSHFIELFNSVKSERPAFMATITAGQMPTMLDDQPEFADIREAIKDALNRGLMLVYIVPSETKVKRLKEHGQLRVAEASEYIDGYKSLIDSIGADAACRLIACDVIDIATPHYVTSLLGDSKDYSSFLRRVVERGPASNGETMLISSHPDYETDIARYVAKVLRNDRDDDFTKLFIRRMGVR